jgi:hypothetical protein
MHVVRLLVWIINVSEHSHSTVDLSVVNIFHLITNKMPFHSPNFIRH